MPSVGGIFVEFWPAKFHESHHFENNLGNLFYDIFERNTCEEYSMIYMYDVQYPVQ